MSATQPYEEKDLLALVASGNEQAFHELVNRYAHLLYTFIFRIVNNRQLAEEVVQDTFVKIWQTREHLAVVEHFKAYLFVVCRNFAIKAAQKALKEQANFDQWVRQQIDNGPQQDQEWKLVMIDEAIAQLPPQQHKVWTMSRKHGMKYAEIAEALGLSKESVKKYLQLANAAILQSIRSRLHLIILMATWMKP